MRKSKSCTDKKLESFGSRLAARSCWLERGHTGLHLDLHGRWASPEPAESETPTA